MVILGPEVTKTSYGLHLCNDQGETVLMDGVLIAMGVTSQGCESIDHTGKQRLPWGDDGRTALIRHGDVVSERSTANAVGGPD